MRKQDLDALMVGDTNSALMVLVIESEFIAADRRWDGDRSVWDRHRDKITTAAGAGGGALIGSIIGGKKGAIIGAIVGGGGAAIYTYGIRDKDGDWRSRRY